MLLALFPSLNKRVLFFSGKRKGLFMQLICSMEFSTMHDHYLTQTSLHGRWGLKLESALHSSPDLGKKKPIKQSNTTT